MFACSNTNRQPHVVAKNYTAAYERPRAETALLFKIVLVIKGGQTIDRSSLA